MTYNSLVILESLKAHLFPTPTPPTPPTRKLGTTIDICIGSLHFLAFGRLALMPGPGLDIPSDLRSYATVSVVSNFWTFVTRALRQIGG